MSRPVVLTFLPHYLPGFKWGGPIRSVSNMVATLGDDLDFRIVTSDRDYLDPEPFPSVAVNEWRPVGKAKVYYAGAADLGPRLIGHLVTETPHDVMYLNSFFNPLFSLVPTLISRTRRAPERARVVAPRGEFSPGAVALKAWKKTPYVHAYRALGLHRDAIWHASTDQEGDDIRRLLGDGADPIVVAANLPTPSRADTPADHPPGVRERDGRLQVCFVSRISPKKNLDLALRILALVSVPVDFRIYGPISDREYWRECQGLIEQVAPPVRVSYEGELAHDEVSAAFRDHRLFLFPTRGENFGHAILEALSAGTHVLTSDQTPWRSLPNGGCHALPADDIDGFVRYIDDLATWPTEKLDAASDAARAYASSVRDDDRTIAANLELFLRAAGVGSGSTAAST